MFIVLEGIDGSGTTTHARLLSAWLRLKTDSDRIISTSEPTQGPIGTLIRSLILDKGQHQTPSWQAMALLFTADRQHHSDTEILPLLQQGKIVICDRYHLSTICYQLASAGIDELPPTSTKPMIELHCYRDFVLNLASYVVLPDLTIVLNVPVGEALDRIAGRIRPADIYEKRDFLERAARLYQAAVSGSFHRVATAALGPIVEVDGVGTQEQVAERIVSEIWKTKKGRKLIDAT